MDLPDQYRIDLFDNYDDIDLTCELCHRVISATTTDRLVVLIREAEAHQKAMH